MTVLIVTWLSLLEPSPASEKAKPFLPTAAYQSRELRGFSLLVNPEVLDHPDEAALVFEELESQLKQIEAAVPKPALAELKKVRFWIEWRAKPEGAAEFHVSRDWLEKNGYNPEKELSVEINNCRHFVEWSRDGQPWMVMHELAHAYHHRVLKHRHAELEAAFDAAVKDQRYDSVAYFRPGDKQKAYAVTNVDEYFAELTEAYFGKNDFFPFNRDELERHDAKGYEVVKTIWGRQSEIAPE